MAPRSQTISAEEKLEDLQNRYQLLEGERRSNVEVSATQIRANKETIRKLTDDNNKLRSDINKLSSSRRIVEDPTEEMIRLKGKLNALRSDNQRKEQLLSELKAQWRLKGGCLKESVEEASEKERKLRVIENRIDKAMIKLNEAQSIKKTYEGILSRLREERVGFDKQLRDLESQLESKKKDMDELVLLSHDAAHAKEIAQAELHKFEQAVLEERNQRDREVMEKKLLVQQRLEMNHRMERMAQEAATIIPPKVSALAVTLTDQKSPKVSSFKSEETTEELVRIQQLIADYEGAYTKLREITGVCDVNEIIQKFMSQQSTFDSLTRQTAEQQHRLDDLENEHKQLKTQLEEAKYSSTSITRRRRSAIENADSLVLDSEQRLDRARARFEKLASVLIDINTGVSHLHAKLSDVKIEPSVTQSVTAATPVTDETIEEILNVCEQKISKLMTTVEGHHAPETTILRSQDVRIRPPENLVDDTDFDTGGAPGGGDGDTVLSRKQIKKNSQQFVEKAMKKQQSK